MSLHDRIMALRKPAKSGNLKFGPALYNSGLTDAAEIAKEADVLMAEMSELLQSCNFDNNTDMREADALVKRYQEMERAK